MYMNEMSASLGPGLRQHCQFLILAFFVTNIFFEKESVGGKKYVAINPYHKLSKIVYLEKTCSVFQQIMKPQTKRAVSIYVNYLLHGAESFLGS